MGDMTEDELAMDARVEASYLTDVERLEAALKAAHAALGSFIWLGNNLHNSCTGTFRELYRAALTDAVTAYEASTNPAEAD